jgi:hypothetical protein
LAVSFASQVRPPDDVLMSELDREAVLLKLKSESYFGLDETGTRMWQLLLSSDSLQIAYDAMLAEFDVDPETLREHLTELVEQLLAHGLVEIVSS